MNKKLTLSVDGKLIKAAKAHAEKTGHSLSEMVESFFRVITEKNNKVTKLNSELSELAGVASKLNQYTDSELRTSYVKHLEKKYL